MASSGNQWAPVVGLALVSASNQMLWLNFAPITTGAGHDLGVPASTVGRLAEVFPLVYVLLGVPVGRALDRWLRPTLVTGTLLTAGGGALRLAGHSFATILAGQVVVAVGQPAVLNAVAGMATRALQPGDRVTGIAIMSAGTFLGFVLAFALGHTLGAGHLHTLLVVSAAIAVACALVLLATLPRLGDRSGDGGTRSATLVDARRARAVWADPVVRTICGVSFLGIGVFVAVTTWAQDLLRHHGVGARAADGLLLVMVAAGVAAAGLVPPAVTRHQAQGLAVGVAALGGGGACVVLAVAPGTATGYVALGVFGLVLLPVLPVMLDLFERRHPVDAATATGMLWLAGNSGGIVITLLVEALVGHPAAAWAFMASGAAVALPLSARLHRQLRSATRVTAP